MEPFVEMTGTGVASATPDVVVLDVAVRSPGVSVAAALADADAKMAQIIAAAAEKGVRGADAQTTSASVYPQYDRDGQHVSSYLAQQSLRLRVRDREQVGTLISGFSEIAGNALAIDNISLQLDDPSALLGQARQAAFEDAAAKAAQYAELAGRRLGAVLYVADSPQGQGPVREFARKAMMAGADAAGMSVEPGENSVTAAVTVRWSWV